MYVEGYFPLRTNNKWKKLPHFTPLSALSSVCIFRPAYLQSQTLSVPDRTSLSLDVNTVLSSVTDLYLLPYTQTNYFEIHVCIHQ